MVECTFKISKTTQEERDKHFELYNSSLPEHEEAYELRQGLLSNTFIEDIEEMTWDDQWIYIGGGSVFFDSTVVVFDEEVLTQIKLIIVAKELEDKKEDKND